MRMTTAITVGAMASTAAAIAKEFPLPMNRLLTIAAATVLAALVTCAQAAAQDRLFRCTVEQVQSLGSLTEELQVEFYRSAIGQQLVFDETGGALFWLGRRQLMNIVQEGTSENSLIALRIIEGPAANSVRLLRVRTYRRPTAFALVDGSVVFSGFCDE